MIFVFSGTFCTSYFFSRSFFRYAFFTSFSCRSLPISSFKYCTYSLVSFTPPRTATSSCCSISSSHCCSDLSRISLNVVSSLKNIALSISCIIFCTFASSSSDRTAFLRLRFFHPRPHRLSAHPHLPVSTASARVPAICRRVSESPADFFHIP